MGSRTDQCHSDASPAIPAGEHSGNCRAIDLDVRTLLLHPDRLFRRGVLQKKFDVVRLLGALLPCQRDHHRSGHLLSLHGLKQRYQ